VILVEAVTEYFCTFWTKKLLFHFQNSNTEYFKLITSKETKQIMETPRNFQNKGATSAGPQLICAASSDTSGLQRSDSAADRSSWKHFISLTEVVSDEQRRGQSLFPVPLEPAQVVHVLGFRDDFSSLRR